MAAAVLAAAVIASAAVTALLYAAGIAGGSTTAVVAQSAHTPADLTAADALNPSALYRGAAAGVVAIEATGVSSGSNGLPYTPTGQSIDTGTGMVINTHGDILTASHVVAGASKITVKFLNGTVRAATTLGTDSFDDASVLRVNPAGLALHPLVLGSTASLVVGDPLAVIGDPFGYNRSLSTGVVSGRDRTIQAPNGSLIANALQTDAAVNPGNSGGPLLDAQGQVVGIADQIATGSSGVDQGSGVGFAVPIDPVKAELSQLEAGRTVLHPYLGVGLQQASINRRGAQVTSVASGSPAAAAGLKAGELITALNGTAVIGPSQLVADLAALKPGDKVTLTVKRGAATANVTATLSSQASRAAAG
ncbi:MAG TPA: trypsin-like peptidase domain-containing protein [Solirubrobacteraceae bacterium]|nr:trypsin-like peptidase domain-containing protein [Solirubrobacteraceae bacterium]